MVSIVLLVDDNPVQAATRQAILAGRGFRVDVATSAAEALSRLENPEIRRIVGLVITDHLMPRMNGPQFVARLREQLPDLPVIVLSGLPDAENEYVGLNVLYRLKPLAPEELIQLVQSICTDTLGRTA